ncbi:MAG: McrC family protein [Proteobacteria bacterium]|nr:McrC family protein [Pseudomonadota bacterium]
MLRVTVLERGRLIRADDTAGDGANETGTPTRRRLPAKLYDRLLRAESAREDRGESAVFSWRRNHCLVGPWVGVMQIPGLQMEILPKTDDREAPADEKFVSDLRSNLMEMLLRGGLGAVRARGLADLSLRRGTLHDRLVDAFLDRALYELRRGVDREYLAEESNLGTLRGKLLLSRHIARNSAQKHRFYCRHDVFSEATPISRRLKQACQLLAGRTLPVALQVKCHQVLALLDDVPEQPARLHEPAPVFNRQNERFEDIYAFAMMLIEGQAADARAGDVETFSLLFDMEQVFERYIAAFLATHVIPRIAGVNLFPQAKGHRFSLYRSGDGVGREDVLRLAPDLLFTLGDPGNRRTFIIDTKWKRLSDKHASRPSNDDLYQLYAYLHRYGCECTFLLYPQTDGVSLRDFDALSQHAGTRVGTVGVRFVDLSPCLGTSEGRAALAQRLETIVREGFGLPSAESEAHVGVGVGM